MTEVACEMAHGAEEEALAHDAATSLSVADARRLLAKVSPEELEALSGHALTVKLKAVADELQLPETYFTGLRKATLVEQWKAHGMEVSGKEGRAELLARLASCLTSTADHETKKRSPAVRSTSPKPTHPPPLPLHSHSGSLTAPHGDEPQLAPTGDQSGPPRPPKKKLAARLTTAALPLALACLLPVVTADDGMPAKEAAAESLLAATVAVGFAALAQASNKLPDWCTPEIAMGAAGTFGALLPTIKRLAPDLPTIKSIRTGLLGSPEPKPLAVPLSIDDDPAGEIVGAWAEEWDRARNDKPSSATPLGIFGDGAVHTLGVALADQVRADAGRDLLEIDVSRCTGRCAARIEDFMVEGSLHKRPGLIFLKNTHAFDGTVVANSERFRDTIAGLETALGPTADGGIRAIKSRKCPKGGKCKIIASLFAVLTSSAHLDKAACATLRGEIMGGYNPPNSMRHIARKERKLTVWADALFDSKVQALLGATDQRWASNAVLACNERAELAAP